MTDVKKDFWGQELSIGDVVAVEEPKYRNLKTAVVVGFTPKQVRVKYLKWERIQDFLTYPDTLVKQPKGLSRPKWMAKHGL